MFTWNENYSVGFDEVDNQHKKFFILSDEVIKYIGDGECAENISSKIKELHNYALWHFNTEKIYMEKCRYEFVDEHLTDHAKILNKINSIQKDVGKFDSDFGSELMVILKDWFINHILVIDKKLYDCLKIKNKDVDIISE